MSTVIGPDVGEFVKIDDLCFFRAEEVEGPPNIGVVTGNFQDCEDCQGGGSGEPGSAGSETPCVWSYIPCEGQEGAPAVKYVACPEVGDPAEFALIDSLCYVRLNELPQSQTTETITAVYDSCEDCAPYIWYDPTCETDAVTMLPLYDPMDANITFDTRTSPAPYDDYVTAPDYIEYFGNCYTKKRTSQTPAVRNNIMPGATHASETACLKPVYHVLVTAADACPGSEGAPDIIIDPSFLNGGAVIKVTATQKCYTIPDPSCANITKEGPAMTAFQYRTQVDWFTPGFDPPNLGDILTCDTCVDPDAPTGSGGGGGPGPGPGGSGGSGVGGSEIPEPSGGPGDSGEGSATPEICEVLCPRVFLRMIGGTYIGEEDHYTECFDMTDIEPEESITKNSGHIATNHPVISSMTVVEGTMGLVDVTVTYAYAAADNVVGNGSVTFTDVAQRAENLYITLPGVSGDTGPFDITLVDLPCEADLIGSSSAASGSST